VPARDIKTVLTSTKGFTLVETLVSLALLLMFFTAIATIFEMVTNIVGESRLKTIGTSLAVEKIELVRNLSYADLGTIGGIPSGVLEQSEVINVSGQDFTVATTVIYIDDPFDNQLPDDPISTDYKRVRVSVSWGGVFASRVPVTLTTDVVPDGLETSEGGGTLIINVINSSGEAVSNASVSIENTSVDPQIDLAITTNNQGETILPGAPACSDCYRIEVTKDGYTRDRTYSLTEIANPLKPDATVIEGEITSLTFTIDESVSIHVETRGPKSSNYPPFAGVQFRLQGSKLLGTDEFDEPVYKYDETLSSGPGGILNLPEMEPDVYEVWIPEGSSVDLAGTSPISPFVVLPGLDKNLLIVTSPATPNNLLVIVQNLEGTPISSALTSISKAPAFIASGSTSIAGEPDNGHIFYPNLTTDTYEVIASKSGYITATGSALVSGDSKILLQMEVNEE